MNEELKCWDGKYPLFIEFDKSTNIEFIENEEVLVAFCALHHLNPHEIQYHEAKPVYAWKAVYIDTKELENYDGELYADIQAFIDEFKRKLREIKRPLMYRLCNSPLKISKSQLASWCTKAKGF